VNAEVDAVEVCNAILSIREQNTIFNAAREADAGNHIAAERHRCFAGYDIGVMAAERKAGR
jgi:hypothetical protein